MGGGQKFGNDVSRVPAIDILTAAAELGSGLEASGGALATSKEFCAREHRVAFRLTNGLVPATGEGVSLQAGEPPQLMGAHGLLGVIESKRAAALNNCLGEEWRLSGTVLSIDTATGKGIALVSGEH
jgi:hypothetical protein